MLAEPSTEIRAPIWAVSSVVFVQAVVEAPGKSYKVSGYKKGAARAFVTQEAVTGARAELSSVVPLAVAFTRTTKLGGVATPEARKRTPTWTTDTVLVTVKSDGVAVIL